MSDDTRPSRTLRSAEKLGLTDDGTEDTMGWEFICTDGRRTSHEWGEWMPHQVITLAEVRFCAKCGGMQMQILCTDPDCNGDHGQRSGGIKPHDGKGSR